MRGYVPFPAPRLAPPWMIYPFMMFLCTITLSYRSTDGRNSWVWRDNHAGNLTFFPQIPKIPLNDRYHNGFPDRTQYYNRHSTRKPSAVSPGLISNRESIRTPTNCDHTKFRNGFTAAHLFKYKSFGPLSKWVSTRFGPLLMIDATDSRRTIPGRNRNMNKTRNLVGPTAM